MCIVQKNWRRHYRKRFDSQLNSPERAPRYRKSSSGLSHFCVFANKLTRWYNYIRRDETFLERKVKHERLGIPGWCGDRPSGAAGDDNSLASVKGKVHRISAQRGDCWSTDPVVWQRHVDPLGRVPAYLLVRTAGSLLRVPGRYLRVQVQVDHASASMLGIRVAAEVPSGISPPPALQLLDFNFKTVCLKGTGWELFKNLQ